MIKNNELDKSPGFLRTFPLSRTLTGTQSDDHAADADALTGL
jgi:hypothetical protein